MPLPRLIPRRELFANPEKASASISPDGTKLAWRQPHEGQMNIWVRTRGSDDARPVTFETTRPVGGFGWTRDSQRILFGLDDGGDENFHIFASDLSGEEPVDLTPMPGVRAGMAALPRNRPDVLLFVCNERDRSKHDLWRLDLRTGERELLVRNDLSMSWVFDDDGVPVAAQAPASDGAGTVLFVPDGDTYRTVKTYLPDDLRIFGVAPDGKLWASTRTPDRDLSGLVLLDPHTGDEELVESDPKGEVDIAGAILREGTRELAATIYVADRHRYEVRDPYIGHVLELARTIQPGDPVLTGRTTDERTWLVSFGSDVDPSATWVLDAETGETEFLFRTRPWLSPSDLAPMHPRIVRSRDGLDLRSYLTLPAGVEPEGLPLILDVHGGPWVRDGWGFNPAVQFYANRGYAVLQVNYRGSSGFGRAFSEAAIGEFGRKMQDDLLDAAGWAVGEGIADPARLAIMGGSYGGYATLAAIAYAPDVFAAAVSLCGPSSLVTLISSFPPYWGPMLANTWHRYVGDPSDPDVAERLKEISPLYAADAIRTPLLVAQGANDPRVTQQESDQMVRALRGRGIDVEYLLAPDEGHGFRDPVTNMAMNRAVELFLAKHLGGRVDGSDEPEVEARLAALRR